MFLNQEAFLQTVKLATSMKSQNQHAVILHQLNSQFLKKLSHFYNFSVDSYTLYKQSRQYIQAANFSMLNLNEQLKILALDSIQTVLLDMRSIALKAIDIAYKVLLSFNNRSQSQKKHEGTLCEICNKAVQVVRYESFVKQQRLVKSILKQPLRINQSKSIPLQEFKIEVMEGETRLSDLNKQALPLDPERTVRYLDQVLQQLFQALQNYKSSEIESKLYAELSFNDFDVVQKRLFKRIRQITSRYAMRFAQTLQKKGLGTHQTCQKVTQTEDSTLPVPPRKQPRKESKQNLRKLVSTKMDNNTSKGINNTSLKSIIDKGKSHAEVPKSRNQLHKTSSKFVKQRNKIFDQIHRLTEVNVLPNELHLKPAGSFLQIPTCQSNINTPTELNISVELNVQDQVQQNTSSNIKVDKQENKESHAEINNETLKNQTLQKHAVLPKHSRSNSDVKVSYQSSEQSTPDYSNSRKNHSLVLQNSNLGRQSKKKRKSIFKQTFVRSQALKNLSLAQKSKTFLKQQNLPLLQPAKNEQLSSVNKSIVTDDQKSVASSEHMPKMEILPEILRKKIIQSAQNYQKKFYHLKKQEINFDVMFAANEGALPDQNQYFFTEKDLIIFKSSSMAYKYQHSVDKISPVPQGSMYFQLADKFFNLLKIIKGKKMHSFQAISSFIVQPWQTCNGKPTKRNLRKVDILKLLGFLMEVHQSCNRCSHIQDFINSMCRRIVQFR